MISWWKRLIYSLGSVLLSGNVCGAILVFPHLVGHATGHLGAAGWAGMLAIFEVLVLTLTLPCWLLTTPIVLLVTKIDGWRFWIYVAIGSAIGPVYWYVRSLIKPYASPGFIWGPYEVVTMTSYLAAMIYLMLVRRRSEHRSLQSSH